MLVGHGATTRNGEVPRRLRRAWHMARGTMRCGIWGSERSSVGMRFALGRVMKHLAMLVSVTLASCGDVASPAPVPLPESSAESDAGTTIHPPNGDCENGSLSFGPVALPVANVGTPYDERLLTHAESGWYGVMYSHGGVDVEALPAGLTVQGKADPRVTGVPRHPGRFTFTVDAIHSRDSNGCSTMPDPHEFVLDVVDELADGGTDASSAPRPR